MHPSLGCGVTTWLVVAFQQLTASLVISYGPGTESDVQVALSGSAAVSVFSICGCCTGGCGPVCRLGALIAVLQWHGSLCVAESTHASLLSTSTQGNLLPMSPLFEHVDGCLANGL